MSCCYDKTPDKSNIREERFLLAQRSQVQSTAVEKEWLQELEVAGHLVSTVKEQREVNAAELFGSVQDSSLWDGAMHSEGWSSHLN